MLAIRSQQRFQREAKAAALLSHPAIVPVYEVGSIGAVDYIAFEYCPGSTLAQFLAESKEQLDQRTAAAIVASLADAVQHAHQRVIIKIATNIAQHISTTKTWPFTP